MRGRAHHAPSRQASPGTLPRPPAYCRVGPDLRICRKQPVLHGLSHAADIKTPILSVLLGPSWTARPFPPNPKNHRSVASHPEKYRTALFSRRRQAALPRVRAAPSARIPAQSAAGPAYPGTANARGILYAPDGRAAEVVSPAARPDIPTEKEVLCPPSTAPL